MNGKYLQRKFCLNKAVLITVSANVSSLTQGQSCFIQQVICCLHLLIHFTKLFLSCAIQLCGCCTGDKDIRRLSRGKNYNFIYDLNGFNGIARAQSFAKTNKCTSSLYSNESTKVVLIKFALFNSCQLWI